MNRIFSTLFLFPFALPLTLFTCNSNAFANAIQIRIGESVTLQCQSTGMYSDNRVVLNGSGSTAYATCVKTCLIDITSDNYIGYVLIDGLKETQKNYTDISDDQKLAIMRAVAQDLVNQGKCGTISVR